MIFALSIVSPEVGRVTGSFISSLVIGSRNSSGTCHIEVARGKGAQQRWLESEEIFEKV